MFQSKKKLIEKIVDNQVIGYSLKNKKDSGEIGKFLESFFLDNTHLKNESDMPGLEFKTKSKNAKSISLATYGKPKGSFQKTYNKIKKNLLLSEYEYKNGKIYINKSTLYSNCSLLDAKRLIRARSSRGDKDFDYSISCNYLPFMYKKIRKIVA